MRADPHSQKTDISINGKERKLVSEQQFWGEDINGGLYYHFDDPTNHGYAIPREGWHDYKDRPTEKIYANQINDWIMNTVLHTSNRNVCVIQGYAGCGKTTFVHHILRMAFTRDPYLRYHNFYIGYIDNALENTFISSSIQTKLIEQITESLQQDDGMQVYNTFVDLFKSDLKYLNRDLQTIFAPMFFSKTNASL